jgi:hypothetical protein
MDADLTAKLTSLQDPPWGSWSPDGKSHRSPASWRDADADRHLAETPGRQ